MPIVSYVPRLGNILDQFRTRRIFRPRHQRQVVWTPSQMNALVLTVLDALPMPAVLMRELDDGTMSLEDGLQRLETLRRYVDGELVPAPVRPGRPVPPRFSDLSALQQANFLTYEVVVVRYSGVDDVTARRIFNYYQGGRPLTVGERLWSVSLTSPIVQFAIDHLMTPDAPLARRLAPVLGEHSPEASRGKDLTMAVALCAGLAHGIDLLSKKWDDLEGILSDDLDEVVLLARLDAYARVWEQVQATAPVTRQERRRKYWDLGNFGGYIAYSILIHGTPEAATYDFPARLEDLIEEWAEHVVMEHRLASRERVPLLLQGMSKARSWKLARWQKGLENVFGRRPENPVAVADVDDGEDTEDEEDTE